MWKERKGSGEGKIAASEPTIDRTIDRSLRSMIPRIECDEMAMIPIRFTARILRLISLPDRSLSTLVIRISTSPVYS